MIRSDKDYREDLIWILAPWVAFMFVYVDAFVVKSRLSHHGNFSSWLNYYFLSLSIAPAVCLMFRLFCKSPKFQAIRLWHARLLLGFAVLAPGLLVWLIAQLNSGTLDTPSWTIIVGFTSGAYLLLQRRCFNAMLRRKLTEPNIANDPQLIILT